jgi:phosphoribosylformimino-5-aminoimidazole carboxamide ribotide isomerase
MLIVPVIDIKGGLVVHARHGDRGRYEPIVTPLSRSAEPEAVLEGLLSAARFEAVYIADLDAITARQPSDPVIERLADRHPMLAFWVDAGISSAAAAAALLAHERFHPVIGSESQSDTRLIDQLRDHPRVLLSLDFRGDDFIGPEGLLDRPERWPSRVIAMTLARVGSGSGPDLERLDRILEKAQGRKVYAAGGVRGRDDAEALAARGAAGVLVATAIHQGAIRQARFAATGP